MNLTMEKLKTLLKNISDKIESNQPVSEIVLLIRILENELLSGEIAESNQNGDAIVVNAPKVFVVKDATTTDVNSVQEIETLTDDRLAVQEEVKKEEEENVIEFDLNQIQEHAIETSASLEEEQAVEAEINIDLEEEKKDVVVLAPPTNIYATPAETSDVIVSAAPVIEEEEKPVEKMDDFSNAKEEIGNETTQKIVEELVVDEEEIEAELGQIKEKAETINKISSHVNPVLAFDFDNDIPTFAQQNTSDEFLGSPQSEINESIGRQQETSSLNDHLRSNNAELSETLADNSPIKDLRKAISVNDKFAFVNELFRGDEAMYNRSIKTVNNFSIYPEAEFWIRRELKTKLGWDEKSDIVKHFDHMVRRRFN